MKLVIPGAAGFVAVNLLQRIRADSRIGERFERIVLVDPLQYEVSEGFTSASKHSLVCTSR